MKKLLFFLLVSGAAMAQKPIPQSGVVGLTSAFTLVNSRLASHDSQLLTLLPTSLFNSYTATIATSLGGKVDASVFTSYTAGVATSIASLSTSSATNATNLSNYIASNNTALGGKVNNTRTITINGQTFDLGNDRTWTVTAAPASYTGNALLIFDGNSITFGKTSNHTITSTTDFAAGPYPSQAVTALVSQFPSMTLTKYNFGVDGQTTADMLSDVTTQIDPLFDPSGFDRNVVFAWEITNQLSNGSGYTAQQAIDNYVAYCKARRAKGFLVVSATVLPRTAIFTGITAAQFETARTTVNTYLRQHYLEFSDALADIASLTTVTLSDGVHPDNTSHNNIGVYVASKIAPLLVAGFNPQSIPFLLAGVTSATTSSGTSSTAVGYVTALTAQPTAAYGLRKLLTAYTGPAVRVRRSSDNTESDIGFTSAGLLDQTALLAFVGSNSGYVRTWYDQKGTNNLAQTSTGNQPRIVNAGTVVVANSVPAVEAIAANNNYMDASYVNTGTSILFAGVYNLRSASGTYGRLWSVGVTTANDYDNPLYMSVVNKNSASALTGSRGNSSFSNSNSSTYNVLQTITSGFNGSSGVLTLNGTQIGTMSVSGNFGTSTFRLFSTINDTVNVMDGYCSEILVFNTYPSSTDLSTIQSNQKAFFGTP